MLWANSSWGYEACFEDLKQKEEESEIIALILAVEDSKLVALEEEQEALLEKLRDLENKMQNLLREDRDNSDEESDVLEEATQVGKAYKELLGKMKELQASIVQDIEALHDAHAKVEEPDNLDKVKKALDRLTSVIGKFSRFNNKKVVNCTKVPCSFYKHFMVVRSQGRYEDQFLLYEEVRHTSALYGKAHKNRGKGSKRGLSLRRIAKKMKSGIEQSEKMVEEWAKRSYQEFTASVGSEDSIRDVGRDIANKRQLLQQNCSRQGLEQMIRSRCRGQGQQMETCQRLTMQTWQRQCSSLAWRIDQDMSQQEKLIGIWERARMEREKERGDNWDWNSDGYNNQFYSPASWERFFPMPMPPQNPGGSDQYYPPYPPEEQYYPMDSPQDDARPFWENYPSPENRPPPSYEL